MEALSSLEQHLFELGFTPSPVSMGGRLAGVILSWACPVSGAAPLLQARLRRAGMRDADQVQLHYNDRDQTLTLQSLHHDIFDEVSLYSPRGAQLLWSVGLDPATIRQHNTDSLTRLMPTRYLAG